MRKRPLAQFITWLAVLGIGLHSIRAEIAREAGVFPDKHGKGETTVVGTLLKVDPGRLLVDAGPAGQLACPSCRERGFT